MGPYIPTLSLGSSSQGRKWKSGRMWCPENQKKKVHQRSKAWPVILFTTEEPGIMNKDREGISEFDNMEVIDYLYKSSRNGIMGTEDWLTR